jgi:hypothetical protein
VCGEDQTRKMNIFSERKEMSKYKSADNDEKGTLASITGKVYITSLCVNLTLQSPYHKILGLVKKG